MEKEIPVQGPDDERSGPTSHDALKLPVCGAARSWLTFEENF